MTRQSVLLLLVGTLSALSGLGAATWVQRDRCVDAGGHWDMARRACELPAGVETGWSLAAVATGIAVAVLVGVMLFRAMLFVTGHASARGARPDR